MPRVAAGFEVFIAPDWVVSADKPFCARINLLFVILILMCRKMTSSKVFPSLALWPATFYWNHSLSAWMERFQDALCLLQLSRETRWRNRPFYCVLISYRGPNGAHRRHFRWSLSVLMHSDSRECAPQPNTRSWDFYWFYCIRAAFTRLKVIFSGWIRVE